MRGTLERAAAEAGISTFPMSSIACTSEQYCAIVPELERSALYRVSYLEGSLRQTSRLESWLENEHIGEMKMTLLSKTLAAAVVAAAIPLAGPAAAAPLSQSLALDSANVGTVEHVQYRHYNDGYYAYGGAPGYAAPGYDEGYYAYGAAPGYVVGPRYRGWNRNFGNGSSATGPGSSAMCPADREQASAYPSWMCR